MAKSAAATGTEPFIDVGDLVAAIRGHDLYRHVNDARSLRILMRSHVFAVWDFQSLLKALQRALTCVEVPWLPTPDPEARRFINEIVLDEESDVCPDGRHRSHFELYHQAMVECGADTGPIDRFISELRAGTGTDDALDRCGAAKAVKDFVRTTLSIATSGSAHRIAAAFSFGREDIIPEMFQKLVDSLAAGKPGEWATFQYYLERHIQNDGDKHAPLAQRIVRRICGEDVSKRRDAQGVARGCLAARVGLWDEIRDAIFVRDSHPPAPSTRSHSRP